jgi:hypothetical protein
MTIKQQGGIFGRNPTFNDVDVDGTLNVQGSTSFSEGITVTSASRITGTDDAVPLLDLRANNTGGGTKNTLRFFDDDGSADNGQQSGRIEFYTDDNTNKGIHSYINSETNTTGYGTLKIGTGLAGSAANRLTIASGGSVTVNTGNLVIGTSGQGIDFSATSGTGTSELFSDYEEGSFTPTLTTDATDFSSVTYDPAVFGSYTKVGNVVHIQLFMQTDAVTKGSASGNVIIGGLPFTADGTSPLAVATSKDWLANYPTRAYVADGATTISLLTNANNTADDENVVVADVKTLGNDNTLRLSGTYRAS